MKRKISAVLTFLLLCTCFINVPAADATTVGTISSYTSSLNYSQVCACYNQACDAVADAQRFYDYSDNVAQILGNFGIPATIVLDLIPSVTLADAQNMKNFYGSIKTTMYNNHFVYVRLRQDLIYKVTKLWGEYDYGWWPRGNPYVIGYKTSSGVWIWYN